MIMNREDIKKIIPHRDPILLVDTVEELVPDDHIVTTFYVNPNMEIFKGHFPDAPILPGVYTAEAMGQSSAILLNSAERYKGLTPINMGLNNLRFKSVVKPGDTLTMRGRIISERKDKAIITVAFEAYVGDVLAASGEEVIAMR